MNDQAKGLLITTIGVLFVVPDALFIRLIDADVLVIAFWRMLLSGVMVLLWLAYVHGRALPATILGIGPNGFIYAFFTFISGILFSYSVTMTSVANTVFIIATMPVFAAIVSWLWLGERISNRMAWTIFFALLGLGVIGYGSLGGSTANILGDLAAVCVAVFFAIALTAARRARAKSMIPAIPVAYICGAVILSLFIKPLEVAPESWPLVYLHGGVFIAVSSCLLALGPRYITSAEVALLILLESVLAPILVWFALGEEPSAYALIGGAIVLATLLISNLIVLKRKRV